MPNGDADLAQGVYAAQLFAARGSCNCTACQLLRTVADRMAQQILKGATAMPAAGPDKALQQALAGLTQSGLAGSGSE
jgi:hypothetical protein